MGKLKIMSLLFQRLLITIKMKKEIIIDLNGINSSLDLMNRFAKVLEWTNWDFNGDAVWDAFDDSLASLHFKELENEENPEVHLVIIGFNKISQNISLKDQNLLKEILDSQEYQTQRIDKYKFSYEFK